MFVKNLINFSKDAVTQFFVILFQVIQNALSSPKNLFWFILWTALSIAAFPLFLEFYTLASVLSSLFIISTLHLAFALKPFSVPPLQSHDQSIPAGKKFACAILDSAKFSLQCLLMAALLTTLFFQPALGLSTPIFFCVYALLICSYYRVKSSLPFYSLFYNVVSPLCNNTRSLSSKLMLAGGLLVFGPLPLTAVSGILGYLLVSVVSCMSARISVYFYSKNTIRTPRFWNAKAFTTNEEKSAYILQKNLLSLIHLKKVRKKLQEPKFHSQEHLESVQHKLDKVSNGRFSVTPPNPLKAPSIDSLGLDEYTQKMQIDAQEKKIIRSFLFANIQYISIQKFDAHLRNSVAQFTAYLKTQLIDDYYVFLTPQTSTQWVFERSCRYLEQLPSTIFDNYIEKSVSLALNKKPGVRTVVIFDDWSISACQITSKIQFLSNQTKQLNIVLVIPYLTLGAYHSIIKTATEINRVHSQSICITICTSGLLNTLNLMLPSKRHPSKQNIDSIIKKGLIRDPLSNIESTKTLLYSDWKKPDYISNYCHLYNQILPIPEVRPCYKHYFTYPGF